MRAIWVVLLWACFSCAGYALDPQFDIKTLSKQEISGYLNGRGMGFAKAAEMHRYPGPSHVLELAEQLHLSDQQLKASQMLFDEMQKRAREKGLQLLRKEEEIEALFRQSRATPEQLGKLLEQAASLRAKLRFVHLAAHIEQKQLLSEPQIDHYTRLRNPHPHQHRHHH